jgi:endo-1,4-beta-xylanase
MKIKHLLITSLVLSQLGHFAYAQDSLALKPITVEAELGKLGSGFSVLKDGETNYVTAKANFTSQSFPEDTVRMITYQISFPAPGSYNLFARIRVGSGGFNDDSFFAGKGFGEKNQTNAADWVFVNGLAGAGCSAATDVVLDQGTVGSEVWKWINLSLNPLSSSLGAFNVSADQLTQVFQIGSREDGLQFDKFAFGKANLYYTVDMLDKQLEGSVTIPGPDLTKYYQGPPLAQGSPKFLGNVKDNGDNYFAKHWNQLTPGNEGKWASVAGQQDTTKWNWSGLDNLYNYAKTNNMLFKDHTLVWGSQQPSWINTLPKEEQLKYIETWMRQVGKRYPLMDMVDVVNEAIATHNPPDGKSNRANYKEALGGDGVTGYDWVIKAFELARKYMPKQTKLILNDYGIINDDNATSIYLKMIYLLKERGLIDGIGVQCHRFEIQNAGLTTLKKNLDRLAATGFGIYISEMDLGDASGDDVKPYDDQLQLQKYQQIFPIFWEHPSVVGVTLWGSLEDKMWQKTTHLINSDGTWRPALKWMAQYIKDTPVTIELKEVKSYTTYFEAECANVGKSWKLIADTLASNGNYLTTKAGVESTSKVSTDAESYITIPVTVDTTGVFGIYARVNCPTSNDDSFWMKVNNGQFRKISSLTTTGWSWKLLSNLTLNKGDNQIILSYCEDGALLDKICVSNYIFPPSGMGAEAINKCDTTAVSSKLLENAASALGQNYPNPFADATQIDFTLTNASDVSLQVFDLVGNLVATLVDEKMDAGNHQVKWDATNNRGSKIANGTYIYRLVTGDETVAKKMLFINQ